MTKIKRTTLLALLGACLAAAGCGSDDEGEPIPTESAALLQSQLDNIEARIENGSVGACEDVLGGPRSPNVEPVQQAIADLPDDVSEDVRTGLEDGFDRLFQLVDERCTELREQAESEQPPETDTEVEPLPPETETVTETEPPPPETETETEEEPVPPPETGEEPTTPEEMPEEQAPSDGGGTGAGGIIAPPEDEL